MGLLGSLKREPLGGPNTTTAAGRGGSSATPNNLCLAAFNNDQKTALELLKTPSALNSVNALVHWVSSSSVTSTQDSQDLEPESPTYEALALCIAAIWGHVDMLQLLLEAGAKPYLKDSRGRTPLVCAIYGAIDTLKITSENYLTITQDNYDHVTIARILLKSLQADMQSSATEASRLFDETVNQPQEGALLKGITPLCLSAYLGKLSMVRCLLEEGAHVDAADKNGATALMYAARDGHSEVVRTLLEFGANVQLKDANGWSAVQYGQSYPDIVQLLEETNLKNNGVHNLLPQDTLNQLSNQHPAFYQNLAHFLNNYSMKHPSSTAPKTDTGAESIKPQSSEKQDQPAATLASSAPPTSHDLLFAIKHQNMHKIKAMLSHPQSTDIINHTDAASGLNPIQYATRIRPLRHPETETIVKLLVRHGALVNSCNTRSGKSPLHYILREPFTMGDFTKSAESSVSQEDKEDILQTVKTVLSVLLKAGADPNISDYEGSRPLHYACQSGQLELVQLLMDHGAAPSLLISNRKGQKPIQLCTSSEMKHYLEGCQVDTKKPKQDSAYHSPELPNKAVDALEDDASLDTKDIEAHELVLDAAIGQAEEWILQFDQVPQDAQLLAEATLNTSFVSAQQSFMDEDPLAPSHPLEQTMEHLQNHIFLLKEAEIRYLEEITRLFETKEEVNLELLKANDIIETFSHQYKEKKAAWESKYEAQSIKLEHQQQLTQAVYSTYSALLLHHQEQMDKNEKERESMQQVIDLQQERIAELESALTSKNKLIDDLGRNVESMSIPIELCPSRRVSTRLASSSSPSRQSQQISLNLAILRSNIKEIQQSIIETQASLSQLNDWKCSLKHGKKRYSMSVERMDIEESKKKHQTMSMIVDKQSTLESELERLKQEEEGLLKQIATLSQLSLEETSQKQSHLVADIERVVQGDSEQVGSDFIALEDLLDNLSQDQPELDDASGDSSVDVEEWIQPLNKRQSNWRMSKMLSEYDIEVNLDTTLMTRLLHAAKSRIHHLKTALVTLRTSNDSLQAELKEANHHLSDAYSMIKTSNSLHAESDSKCQRLQSELHQLNHVIKKLEHEREKMHQERVNELDLLQSIHNEFVGETGLPDSPAFLSRLDKIIAMVDSSFLSKLKSKYSSETVESSIARESRITTLLQGKSQLHSALSSCTQLIKDAVRESSDKFDLVEQVLVYMKEENKKYVKEILKLRNTALLKSFVNQVKDADKAVADLDTMKPSKPTLYHIESGNTNKEQETMDAMSYKSIVIKSDEPSHSHRKSSHSLMTLSTSPKRPTRSVHRGHLKTMAALSGEQRHGMMDEDVVALKMEQERVAPLVLESALDTMAAPSLLSVRHSAIVGEGQDKQQVSIQDKQRTSINSIQDKQRTSINSIQDKQRTSINSIQDKQRISIQSIKKRKHGSRRVAMAVSHCVVREVDEKMADDASDIFMMASSDYEEQQESPQDEPSTSPILPVESESVDTEVKSRRSSMGENLAVAIPVSGGIMERLRKINKSMSDIKTVLKK